MDNKIDFSKMKVAELRILLTKYNVPGRSKIKRKEGLVSAVKAAVTLGFQAKTSEKVETMRVDDSMKMTAIQKGYFMNICRVAEEKGWRVKSKVYKDINTSINFVCPNGHDVWVTPHGFKSKRNKNGCRVCVGRDPNTAKKAFYNKIKELGGKVIGEYKGARTPVSCICPKGHQCNPRPNGLQQGRGMCKECFGDDFEGAKVNFHKRIKALGGTVVGEYTGINRPVACICPKGHKCNTMPVQLRIRNNMCKVCSDRDFEAAKARFHKRVKELGGKVIGEYKRASAPVDCICSKGHKCKPTPQCVRGGFCMCPTCSRLRAESKGASFVERF